MTDNRENRVINTLTLQEVDVSNEPWAVEYNKALQYFDILIDGE